MNEEAVLIFWLNSLELETTVNIDSLQEITIESIQDVIRLLLGNDLNKARTSDLLSDLNSLETTLGLSFDFFSSEFVSNNGRVSTSTTKNLIRVLRGIYKAGSAQNQVDEGLEPPPPPPPPQQALSPARPSFREQSIPPSPPESSPPPSTVAMQVLAVRTKALIPPCEFLEDRFGCLSPSTLSDGLVLCYLVLAMEKRMGFAPRRDSVVRKINKENLLFFAGVEIHPRARAAKLKNIELAIQALRDWKKFPPKLLFIGPKVVDAVSNDGLLLLSEMVGYTERHLCATTAIGRKVFEYASSSVPLSAKQEDDQSDRNQTEDDVDEEAEEVFQSTTTEQENNLVQQTSHPVIDGLKINEFPKSILRRRNGDSTPASFTSNGSGVRVPQRVYFSDVQTNSPSFSSSKLTEDSFSYATADAMDSFVRPSTPPGESPSEQMLRETNSESSILSSPYSQPQFVPLSNNDEEEESSFDYPDGLHHQQQPKPGQHRQFQLIFLSDASSLPQVNDNLQVNFQQQKFMPPLVISKSDDDWVQEDVSTKTGRVFMNFKPVFGGRQQLFSIRPKQRMNDEAIVTSSPPPPPPPPPPYSVSPSVPPSPPPPPPPMDDFNDDDVVDDEADHHNESSSWTQPRDWNTKNNTKSNLPDDASYPKKRPMMKVVPSTISTETIPPLVQGSVSPVVLRLSAKSQSNLLQFLKRSDLGMLPSEKHSTRVWLYRLGFNVLRSNVHSHRAVPIEEANTKTYWGYEGGPFLGDPFRNGQILFELACMLERSLEGESRSLSVLHEDNKSFPSAKQRVDYAFRALGELALAHGLKRSLDALLGEHAKVGVLSGGKEIWTILFALSLAFPVERSEKETMAWESLYCVGLVSNKLSMGEADWEAIFSGQILSLVAKSGNGPTTRGTSPRTRRTALAALEKHLTMVQLPKLMKMNVGTMARRILDGDVRLFLDCVEHLPLEIIHQKRRMTQKQLINVNEQTKISARPSPIPPRVLIKIDPDAASPGPVTRPIVATRARRHTDSATPQKNGTPQARSRFNQRSPHHSDGGKENSDYPHRNQVSPYHQRMMTKPESAADGSSPQKVGRTSQSALETSWKIKSSIQTRRSSLWSPAVSFSDGSRRLSLMEQSSMVRRLLE